MQAQVQRQKKPLSASEQDTQRVKDLRFAYRLWSFTIAPRNLVFIDETGIHLGMTRLYGRAPVGERLYDSEAPGDGGKNISLIGGMSLDGLIAALSVVGSVNTEVFLFYVQAMLIPQLWVGAIVVMDNLPAHHALVVREAIEAVGAKVVFLPPYSPDLSPIELCWSKLKQLLLVRSLWLIHLITAVRIVGRLFQRAEDQAQQQIAGQTRLQLDEVELSVEISAEGEVKLVAGVKAAGKGAITLKFKRKELES